MKGGGEPWQVPEAGSNLMRLVVVMQSGGGSLEAGSKASGKLSAAVSLLVVFLLPRAPSLHLIHSANLPFKRPVKPHCTGPAPSDLSPPWHLPWCLIKSL